MDTACIRSVAECMPMSTTSPRLGMMAGTVRANIGVGLTRARCSMGSKPSNIFQMDRPESGGADRKEEREASGRLNREKQRFAEAQTRKKGGDEKSAVGRRAAGGQGKRRGSRS